MQEGIPRAYLTILSRTSGEKSLLTLRRRMKAHKLRQDMRDSRRPADNLPAVHVNAVLREHCRPKVYHRILLELWIRGKNLLTYQGYLAEGGSLSNVVSC